jgi:hypothetical protein
LGLVSLLSLVFSAAAFAARSYDGQYDNASYTFTQALEISGGSLLTDLIVVEGNALDDTLSTTLTLPTRVTPTSGHFPIGALFTNGTETTGITTLKLVRAGVGTLYHGDPDESSSFSLTLGKVGL